MNFVLKIFIYIQIPLAPRLPSSPRNEILLFLSRNPRLGPFSVLSIAISTSIRTCLASDVRPFRLAGGRALSLSNGGLIQVASLGWFIRFPPFDVP